MRQLLRTGAGAFLVVAIMFIGSLVLWIGTPLLWLWVGSQIQGQTSSLGAALGAMFVGRDRHDHDAGFAAGEAQQRLPRQLPRPRPRRSRPLRARGRARGQCWHHPDRVRGLVLPVRRNQSDSRSACSSDPARPAAQGQSSLSLASKPRPAPAHAKARAEPQSSLPLAAGELTELVRQHPPLSVGEGPDALHLADLRPREKFAAPRAAPAPLTHQQVSDRPAARLPGAREDDLSRADLTLRDPSLELGTRQPHFVRSLQGAQSLWLRCPRGDSNHVAVSLPAPFRVPRRVDEMPTGTATPSAVPAGTASYVVFSPSCARAAAPQPAAMMPFALPGPLRLR